MLTIPRTKDTPLAQLLAGGRARAAAMGRSVLVSLVEPVPAADPLALFARAAAAGDRVYWEQPAKRFALAGVGAAIVLEPTGPERFAAAGDAWRALLDSALIDGAAVGGNAAAGPLLVGGFAFEAARVGTAPWPGFPDARLVVPRLQLVTTAAGSWLTTSALVGPADDADVMVDTLAAERAFLFGGAPAGDGAPEAAAEHGVEGHGLALTELPLPDLWRRTVADVATEIRAGELDKVVLARTVRARATAPFDVPRALRRLRAAYPGCYVFAVARGGRTFLGASPERLVRLRGRDVQATSLAGSVRRGATSAEDAALVRALVASAKDQLEHALVVRGLREALATLCDDVAAPAEPALLTMANVHHLSTPVAARLRAGYTLADLLARLHPTPAVAGWPREAALAVIREREPFHRGWYAAPVGWLGRDGGGDFAVALRSALVHGAEASLFAGCGLMGDSDPAEEYAESWLKLRPMLAALGGATR